MTVKEIKLINILRVVTISIVIGFITVSFSGVISAQDSPEELPVESLVTQVGDTVANPGTVLYEEDILESGAVDLEEDIFDIDHSSSDKGFGAFLGLGIGFMIVMMLLGIGLFILWIWALVNVLTKPVENKLIWVLVIILLGFLGAILYYFIGRNKDGNTDTDDDVVIPVSESADIPDDDKKDVEDKDDNSGESIVI